MSPPTQVGRLVDVTHHNNHARRHLLGAAKSADGVSPTIHRLLMTALSLLDDVHDAVLADATRCNTEDMHEIVNLAAARARSVN